MLGRVLNFFAIVSLLLFLATAAMWVSSGLKVLHLRYNRAPRADETYAYYLGFKSYGGTLSVEINRRHYPAAYFSRLGSTSRSSASASRSIFSVVSQPTQPSVTEQP